MTVEMPGTRPWLRTLKAEFTTPALPASVGIPLGGKLHNTVMGTKIKPGTRAYRAKLRTEAGLSILTRVEEEVGPLTITTPTAGATVPPVHDITGRGAVPGSNVELWYVEGDQMVATAAADVEGNWLFGGDTPAALGTVTWQVRQGPRVSAEVTVTVQEPVGMATGKRHGK